MQNYQCTQSPSENGVVRRKIRPSFIESTENFEQKKNLEETYTLESMMEISKGKKKFGAPKKSSAKKFCSLFFFDQSLFANDNHQR